MANKAIQWGRVNDITLYKRMQTMTVSLLSGIVVMLGLFIYSFVTKDVIINQLCLALSVSAGANNFRIIFKNNPINANEFKKFH